MATLLIPSGKMAYSRFCIPLAINEYSTCNIKQMSDFVELIAKARLIIWDEAPMVHKHCFEALDKTWRDVLQFGRSDIMEVPFVEKLLYLVETSGRYYR
ncbi:hypothetical protein Syun_008951 [Stephania yunnanensis]|uniref:ATP-dependent DNA helicase n=1 Tax=Stephania yunnanensis TaxID=152371 RepID=A0AAP0KDS1_9MAGN